MPRLGRDLDPIKLDDLGALRTHDHQVWLQTVGSAEAIGGQELRSNPIYDFRKRELICLREPRQSRT
jgi:hypothetical protein